MGEDQIRVVFEKNLDYNVKMGERQTDDIPMKGNWWGESDLVAIEGSFYDGRIEPGVGRVLFEPFLTEKPMIRIQNAERRTQEKSTNKGGLTQNR